VAGMRPSAASLLCHPRPVFFLAAAATTSTKNDTDISPIRRRRPMSEETKQKISQSRKGVQHSEETKLKISQSMKNRPPRTIGKISDFSPWYIYF
jgi:hypothetical protein